MRMYRPFLPAVVIAVFAAMVGSACGVESPSVRAPFARVSFTEAGGWSVMASSPSGVTLRFVPDTAFGIGIVLRNRTATPITLLDVEAFSAPNGLVQQVGTVLAPWNPPRCPGTHSCPGVGFLRAPYAAARPSVVAVAARGEAAVQLNFRLRGCDAVPFAVAGAPDRIDITYRVGGSALASQELSLGGAKLNLRMPSRRDCLPRPKSTIAVDGPYATGSGWTMPTSSGDNCRRTGSGALVFASRVYLAPQKPMVRILIRLPRFRGTGLYRSLPKPAPALGAARVTAVVGIGIHGWQHFHSSTAIVSVRKETAKTIVGRFHAIVGYRRSTFRTYGAWRCELAAKLNRGLCGR
jgi:hypothetical protein